MKKPLLVFGAWGVAFLVVLIGLIIAGPSNPRFTGTVVLDFKPFCQNFVVQIERGFGDLDVGGWHAVLRGR